MNLQKELEKQAKLFEPKETERICYQQPKEVNGRTEYQQPSPCKTNN